MKNRNLKNAINRAECLGLNVTRNYFGNGLIMVSVYDSTGLVCKKKTYKAGNASAQADFINHAVDDLWEHLETENVGCIYVHDRGTFLIIDHDTFIWNGSRWSSHQINIVRLVNLAIATYPGVKVKLRKIQPEQRVYL